MDDPNYGSSSEMVVKENEAEAINETRIAGGLTSEVDQLKARVASLEEAAAASIKGASEDVHARVDKLYSHIFGPVG